MPAMFSGLLCLSLICGLFGLAVPTPLSSPQNLAILEGGNGGEAFQMPAHLNLNELNSVYGSDQNMKLMILGEKYPTNSANYRGINRETPDPVEGCSIYWELIERPDNYLILNDLDFAEKMVGEYGSLHPPQHFEIVEITDDNDPPEINNGKFLGFDVTQNYFVSALSFGLDLEQVIKNSPDIDPNLVSLFRLAQAYFQPKLNENGLFSCYEEAIFFQEVLKALRILLPGFIEGGISIFKAQGVWLIPNVNSGNRKE